MKKKKWKIQNHHRPLLNKFNEYKVEFENLKKI